MILRGFLSLAAILLTLYFLKVAQNRPLQKIAMSIPFLLVLIFAIHPPASTQVAHVLGVGRGVDLVLYLSSFVLLVLTFTLYLNQRLLREQVLLLARNHTLQQIQWQTSKAPAISTSEHRIEEDSEQSSAAPSTWALIPAYNESKAILQVVHDLLHAHYGVVIVNDGSNQESTQVLQILQKQYANDPLYVLTHPINLGQGAALQTGFDYIYYNLSSHYPIDYIVTFDADGQHRVEDIEHLIAALIDQPHIEIALGSRFLGQTVNMPWQRYLLLKMAVIFTRYVGGVQVSDSHNGLRALRLSVLQRLRLSQARMAHASEFLHLLKHLEIQYTEVAVTIEYTSHSLAKGQSALGAINILFDLMVKRIFGI